MKLEELGLEEEILEVFKEVERKLVEANLYKDLSQQVNTALEGIHYMTRKRKELKFSGNYSEDFVEEQFSRGSDYIICYVIPNLNKLH